MNIAFIQSPLLWENPKANQAYFEQKIKQLDKRDLILLPEMFNTGFSMNSVKLAEEMHGSSMQWMRKMALETGSVICGSIIIQEKGQYFNRLIWMQPNGEFQKYDKRHLFRMANEDKHFSAGKDRLIVELKSWKIMPLICYDLRFPVWSRNLFKINDKHEVIAEYDLCLYIANWPEARVTAWNALLRARAIENQSFVCGLNRTGEDGNGVSYNGMSAVIDPKGNAIIEANDESEKVGICSLNYSELEEFRKKFPVGMDADSFDLKN